MYRITCPHCGPRAQSEFTYERTVDSVVDPAADTRDRDAGALYPRQSDGASMTKSGGIRMAAGAGWC